MRLTVLTQTAKGLPETAGEGEDQEPLRSEVLKTLESIKWYLWHGNVFQAFRHLQFVEMDLESAAFESQDETTRKLLKAVEEFSTYIQRNGGFIPNHGERSVTVRESALASWNRRSIKSSVSASPRSSRCGGHLEGALVAAGPYSRPQRGMGGRIPPLVSRFRQQQSMKAAA